MSNVVRFPFAVSRRAFARLPRRSENGTPEERAAKRTTAEPEAEPIEIEPRVKGRRQARRMVFRSYALIVQSAEADLMRDVCFDLHKAQVKLKAIRRQIAADREHAAAREKLLTSAESRLSAAIVAARPLTAGKGET
jgi:hypothetical protein